MNPIITSSFILISFEPGSLAAVGIEGRDEIEDPLDDAFTQTGLGAVVGGGGGVHGSNIDIEIEDMRHIDSAIDLIRRVLKDLHAPASTTMKQQEPEVREYPL